MANYSYNPYQPDGNNMNAAQRSQYGFARTESRPAPTKMGRMSNAVTTTQWIGSLFLLCIPVVGIICLLVWAFSDNTSASMINFARAVLLIILIFIVIPTIVFVVLCLIMWPTIAAALQPIIEAISGALALLTSIAG